MPIFAGKNIEGWIIRAERYCNVIHLSENGKLFAARVSFQVSSPIGKLGKNVDMLTGAVQGG